MGEKVKRGIRNEDGSYTYHYDRSSSLGGKPRADLIAGNEAKKPKMKKKMSIINRKSGSSKAEKPKGRMFLASTFRALDEAKEEKNYKKKDRIMQSGDKDRIKLMESDLLRLGSGGDASCGCSSCMGESTKGAGAAVKGTNFKGVF